MTTNSNSSRTVPQTVIKCAENAATLPPPSVAALPHASRAQAKSTRDVTAGDPSPMPDGSSVLSRSEGLKPVGSLFANVLQMARPM